MESIKSDVEIYLKQARVDLTATVDGKFSPSDWQLILARAETQLRGLVAQNSTLSTEAAWHQVMRDYYASRYWGFKPNYKAPRQPRKPINMGYMFIWILFNTLTIMKVAVLWYGAKYSRGEEGFSKWMFFAILLVSFGGFVHFLWRYQNQPD